MEQQVLLHDQDERMTRASCSLEGLSIGDAFGEQFFHQPDLTADRIASHTLPLPPWPYTDDTQMALSIVSVLRQYGTIEQDRLMESFAEQYDPSRGYGPSLHRLLRSIRAGNPWREATAEQFAGQDLLATVPRCASHLLALFLQMRWIPWSKKPSDLPR